MFPPSVSPLYTSGEPTSPKGLANPVYAAPPNND